MRIFHPCADNFLILGNGIHRNLVNLAIGGYQSVFSIVDIVKDIGRTTVFVNYFTLIVAFFLVVTNHHQVAVSFSVADNEGWNAT